ncbi:hypothetical protein ACOMHN_040936 [Nucella lapillus]
MPPPVKERDDVSVASSTREDCVSVPLSVGEEDCVSVPQSVGEEDCVSVPLSVGEEDCESECDTLSEQQGQHSAETVVKGRVNSSHKKRKHRRRAALHSPISVRARGKPSPTVSVSVLNRLTQLQLDVEELSSNQAKFQNNFMTVYEDIKASTKK